MAALLVLVGVAGAAVATTAYLASRAGAPQVGVNVVRATQARFAAESGLDLGIAIMQCDDLDWRTAHVNGVLVDNYDFGGGRITVTVTDLEGNPPNDETEHVILTVLGDIAGMRQVATAVLYAPRRLSKVDIDLSEFAIFGSSSITIDDAAVTRWNRSSRSAFGEPIRLGTNNISASSVNLTNQATVIDGLLYYRGDASGLLIYESDAATSLDPVIVTNTQSLPVPAAPYPNLVGLLVALNQNPSISGGTVMNVSTSRIYSSITVSTGAELRFNTAGTRNQIAGNLLVQDGGFLVITEPVDLYVGGDVTIRNESAIEIVGNGRLRLFIDGDLRIESSVVGLPRQYVGVARDPRQGVGAYYDPTRCTVYKTPLSLPATWNVRDNSFACAILYGRSNLVRIRDQSALFGHAVAAEAVVDYKAVVHYDHHLDDRLGYTNPDSALFLEERVLDETLTSLATDLNDSTLTLINSLIEDEEDDGGDPYAGDATPRNQQVHRLRSDLGHKWNSLSQE